MLLRMVWNDKAVERLRQMVADGDRPSKIGKAMGCSRNAIIGKMLRLGINSHYNNRRHAKRPILKPIPAPKRLKATFNFRSAAAQKPVEPTPLVAATHVDDVVGCSIFELSDHRCKWPIGTPGTAGFGFCGIDKSPDSGSPYCPDHAARSCA